jgi:hypothetical protein
MKIVILLLLYSLAWQATATEAPDISDGDSCAAHNSEPLPNMGLYADAQSYVQHTDEAFRQKYFEAGNNKKGPQLVKHLIVGRGIAGTNVFSATYCNVQQKRKSAQSKCTNMNVARDETDIDSPIQDQDVLVVGDNVTGLWDNSTYTFAQPFSAMEFPFLPYNPKDFVRQRRIDQNDFVSCIDLHKAIMVSQGVLKMPVMTAVVFDIVHRRSNETSYCNTTFGSNFTVSLKQTASYVNQETTTTICVNEIDIATGNGLPRDIFKDTKEKYGLNETSYNSLIAAGNPDVFGGAPALISYREFVLTPNEATAGTVAMRQNEDMPTIIIYGGGGTVLAAIRRAMLGKDDISTNPIYVNSDGKYNGKNPQMLTEVLDNPLSQNAKVLWFSRDPLDGADNALAGSNAVRIGSSYDIISVFGSASNMNYTYGQVRLEYDLINVDATSKIATFCPLRNQTDCNGTVGESQHCCNERFDQFVECIGEDDTVESEELWAISCKNPPKNRTDCDRFGPMTVLCTSEFPFVHDGIPSSLTLAERECIPYAVGFQDTGDSLRLHGAVAAKEGKNHDFQKVSQHFLDNGRVTALTFYGNMFFMGALLQVYATGVLKKKITKVNVAMDLQEVILQFMTQCGVPDQASRDFLSHLRLVHSGVFRQTFQVDAIRWPLHPAGMLPDSSDKVISLNEHIQSRKELSNHVAIQDGVTLVCRSSRILSFFARLRTRS